MTNGELIAGEEKKQIEERIVMRQLLNALDKQDRRLIELRFFSGKTQAETGEALGMTQVQVCRREKKLLIQMRTASGSE